MMATVHDVISIMGYVLECGVLDDQNTSSSNELLRKLSNELNALTYQIGGWSVANEEPWAQQNIGGSKLSVFQGRFNLGSFGSECDGISNCIYNFKMHLE